MYIDGELEVEEVIFKEAWVSDRQELKDEIGKENMGCHIEQVFLYSSVIGAKLFSYREVPE